jgi:hypothetical protein
MCAVAQEVVDLVGECEELLVALRSDFQSSVYSGLTNLFTSTRRAQGFGPMSYADQMWLARFPTREILRTAATPG